MSRDYAPPSKRKQKKIQRGQRAGAVRYLLAGIVLGLGLAIFVYLRWAGDKIPSIHLRPAHSSAAQKSRTRDFPAVKERSTPEFSFPDLLEHKTVTVPEQTRAAKVAPSGRTYVMQCGSFRRRDMAQSLKAQIALAGFASNIRATDEKDGRRWFRVVLGPYQSKRRAESDRHQLNRNGTEGCQIW